MGVDGRDKPGHDGGRRRKIANCASKPAAIAESVRPLHFAAQPALPKIRSNRMSMRSEHDSLGPVDVADDRYWGAQTQRSSQNFRIGERMPIALVHALALVKQTAARVNNKLGLLKPALADAIEAAAGRVVAGEFDDHFPLVVYQTGSGTQSNMNANEVIANVANEALGGRRGEYKPIHPNDHVNLGQSSNDSFPTAMSVAAALRTTEHLLPALKRLQEAFARKAEEFASIVKIGRTHLQDATPLTLGDEFSGYEAQVALGIERIESALKGVYSLAQGGTAVGTGLNAHRDFGRDFAADIAKTTGLPFITAANKYEALAGHDALTFLHAAIANLATSLMKIGDDLRLMASGPRSGLGEISLPANEPGSSIMPGKVNPTQIEALTMVCARIMGNHTTMMIANSQGRLELNVYKPVIAQAVLQSIELMADCVDSFTTRCVEGVEAKTARISELVERSLMLVTALAPAIGYEKAATIARRADDNNTTLREEAMKSGYIDAKTFDELTRPETMIGPR
jgi:fumarate hydratase class II